MKLNELIHQIYNTVDEPDTWRDVLTTMSRELNSTHVFLLARTGVKAQPFTFVETGFNQGYFDLYQQYFYQHDIWTQSLIHHAPNLFHNSHEVCDDRDYLQSEIYNDFAKVEGIRHSMGCLIVNNEQGMFAEVGFMRDEAQGHYDTKTRLSATVLVKHLRQVLGISQQLNQLKGLANDFQQLLNHAKEAIFICNDQEIVLQLNTVAEQLLRQEDIIRLNSAKQLLFMDAKAQQQFWTVKAHMKQLANPSGDESFILHSQKNTYRLKIQPWLYSHVNALGTVQVPAFLLTVQPIRTTVSLNVLDMMAYFGFTKAEAEVAELLCHGLTTEEIAVNRSAAVTTVRQQVKACLSKTQCRSQTELVRAILMVFL